MMETTCLQCGDVGFKNAFVYCVKCLNFAVHRYCLDVIPETLDEFVRWLCDDCGGIVQKRSTIKGHNAKVISAFETKEKDEVVAQEHGCKNTSGEHDISFQKIEEEKVQDCVLQDQHFPENISLKEMVKRKKQKRAKLQDQHFLGNVSLKEVVKGKKRRHEVQDILVNEDVHTKKMNRSSGDNKSSKQSHKECTKMVTNLLTDSKLRPRCSKPRVKRDLARKLSDPRKTKNTNGSLKKMRDKNGIVSSTGAIAQEETCRISSAQSLLEDRVVINKEPDNVEDKMRNSSKDDPKNSPNPYPEPVISPIWRGSFYIRNKKYSTLKGLVAHMCRKACQKVFDAASKFQRVLCLEKLPRSEVWPKSFKSSVPTSSNIGLYFFPTKKSVREFDCLVKEMMDKDLALKCAVQNAELLIFTSTELPLLYWRFQGKHYLWGVFKGKQSS